MRRGPSRPAPGSRALPLAPRVLIPLVMVFLLWQPAGPRGSAQQPAPPAPDPVEAVPDTVSIIREVPLEELQDTAAQEQVSPDSAAQVAWEDASDELRQLWTGLIGNLPRYGVALGILLLAWLLVRLLRPLLRHLLREWGRADALTVISGLVIWAMAIAIAMSVLVSDLTALVGSLGLIGLALSWALQTPIESFTGWMMNSFRGYYRLGDRIAVPDRNVYGDVYEIDLLTTTLWEYGGPERPDVHVHGEQATGRLITFPNNEILTGTIVNYTRDFPFVWDEVQIRFHRSSDIPYLMQLMKRAADEVIGPYMAEPAKQYAALLESHGLDPWAGLEPQIYLALEEEKWVLVIVRYLVGARERRRWETRLLERILADVKSPESKGRVTFPTPRRLIKFLDEKGRPATPWVEWRQVAKDG